MADTSIGSDVFKYTPFLNNQTTTVKYAGKWVVDCDEDATKAEIKDGTVGIASYACSIISALTAAAASTFKNSLKPFENLQ